MQMEISLEIYRWFQVWNAPNVISKTKSETTGLTRWGGRVRFSEAEAEADGPMDFHPVKCMDFCLKVHPFRIQATRGIVMGTQIPLGVIIGPDYKEFPIKGGSNHPQYREWAQILTY